MSESRGWSATKVMVAVFSSRILGLIREVVLNAIFGAGKELDALIAAFRIPNLLRDLFAEGALSSAFVTTFSQKLKKDSKESSLLLARRVMTLLIVGMGFATLLGIVLAEPLVHLLNPGFSEVEGKLDLTIELTRIIFPFIFFVSLAALYMGLLNSLGSFGLPASASAVFNVVSILSGLGLGWWWDPGWGVDAVYGFAIGIVLGGVCQWLIQVPRAMQLGFFWSWNWLPHDPDVRKVGALMLPGILGGAAVQVNVLVNGWFASHLGDGAVTCLYNAFRLMQLPIGIFGVAIAMVTLPKVAQDAAGADLGAFREKIGDALGLVFFLTIPSSVGLALLSEPIISAIYQHGAFTREDALVTASLLGYQAIGLAAYSGIKVLSPAFLAVGKPYLPLRVSLMGIGLNWVLNYTFIYGLELGLIGLPLSLSLVALLNFGQLFWAMRGVLSGIDGWRLLGVLFRIGIASAGMAGVVWWINGFWEWNGFLECVVFLGCAIPLGAMTYFGLGAALGLREIRDVYEATRRKLG